MTAIAKKDEMQQPAAEPANLVAVIARLATDPQADVVKFERMVALYERIEAKRAETDFNVAMNEAQHEMGPISADANNPQTRSKYATYAKLDRVLRPIYTRHGFSISYDEADSPKPDHIRVLAYVSRGGHVRTYHKDMPADGKGAKGGDVMTKTHAAGAAMTYGMRYLLKGIFNVAIGENDDDGNSATDDGPVANPIYDKIEVSETVAELQKVKPEIGGAKVAAHTKRNLIASYNAKLRKLKEAAQ